MESKFALFSFLGFGVDDNRVAWWPTMILLHRMYEAHFLPAHLALLMIAGTIYPLLVPASRTPSLLLQALDLTTYMRLLSLTVLFAFFILYERYHELCVSTREREMTAAGLEDRMVGGFSYRRHWTRGLDYVLFPVSGVLFGSFPTIVALVWHFWTLRLVYRVSVKPKRASASV